MDEGRTAEELVQASREVYADIHHRARQERARGDADALAHVLEQAERTGVSVEERRAMASEGYHAIARRLVRPPKAKRRWKDWVSPRREDRRLPSAPRRPELPPGD
ncbi:MAG TPA: hypothetical protein VF587_06975 [Solirubrobacteraceae bacterium]|jgi:hypothetical protein